MPLYTSEEPSFGSARASPLTPGAATVEADADALAALLEERRTMQAQLAAHEQVAHLVMAVLGHDLRSPLAALTASSAALLRRADLPPACRPAAERVARSTSRVREVGTVLLDYLQVHFLGRLALTRSAHDLGHLCEHAVARLQPAYPGRRVVLEREGELQAEVDAERIIHAVACLVDNALKYGASDGEVRVRAVGRGSELSLEVHNVGNPIAPAAQARLFEPFGGAACRDGTVRLSLGLSLFLAQHVARAHGGTLAVESSPEAGTRLRLTLERWAPEDAPAPPSWMEGARPCCGDGEAVDSCPCTEGAVGPEAGHPCCAHQG
jgi:signal transduction histidine kinase